MDNGWELPCVLSAYLSQITPAFKPGEKKEKKRALVQQF
jgi:hypothetical protein